MSVLAKPNPSLFSLFKIHQPPVGNVTSNFLVSFPKLTGFGRVGLSGQIQSKNKNCTRIGSLDKNV